MTGPDHAISHLGRAHAGLVEAVRHNAHLSDAHFAQDYPLCIYLLKMRELYRWELGLGFQDELPQERLGGWIEAREGHWQTLLDHELSPLPLGAEEAPPFSYERVNESLTPAGLFYGAGYGYSGKPIFFLADLLEHRRRGEVNIFICGHEHVRDIVAPPAMLNGPNIIIRRESIQRFLWEQIEAGQWNRQESAIHRAMAFYSFDRNFADALETMTEQEMQTILLHELGEYQAGKDLGADWEEMLAALPPGRTEMMVRFARDHLVDCKVVLPRLIEERNEASLHFYRSNLEGLRAAMFPQLVKALDRWTEDHSFPRLHREVEAGTDHWRRVNRRLVDCFRRRGNPCEGEIEGLLRAQPL